MLYVSARVSLHTVQNIGKQDERDGYYGAGLLECSYCLGTLLFFNDTATTEIYTLSLHDALPIYWGVSVGFLLLIASWFVPRNTVDFLVDFIVTGLMLVVAIRIGCVIVRVRRGDELSRESARSVRFREVMGNVVFLSFFVIALLLIAWRYLR